MGCAASFEQQALEQGILPIRGRPPADVGSVTEQTKLSTAKNAVVIPTHLGVAPDIVLVSTYTGFVTARMVRGHIRHTYGHTVWELEDLVARKLTPRRSASNEVRCSRMSTASSGSVPDIAAMADGGAAEICPDTPGSRPLPPSGNASMSLIARCASSKLGVIFVISSGSILEEVMLEGLRAVQRFRRPFVLVHDADTCRLPDVCEWPSDLMPLLAASRPLPLLQRYIEAGVDWALVELAGHRDDPAVAPATPNTSAGRQQALVLAQQPAQQKPPAGAVVEVLCDTPPHLAALGLVVRTYVCHLAHSGDHVAHRIGRALAEKFCVFMEPEGQFPASSACHLLKGCHSMVLVATPATLSSRMVASRLLAALQYKVRLVVVAEWDCAWPAGETLLHDTAVADALRTAWPDRLLYHPDHAAACISALEARLGIPDSILSQIPLEVVTRLKKADFPATADLFGLSDSAFTELELDSWTGSVDRWRFADVHALTSALAAHNTSLGVVTLGVPPAATARVPLAYLWDGQHATHMSIGDVDDTVCSLLGPALARNSSLTSLALSACSTSAGGSLANGGVDGSSGGGASSRGRGLLTWHGVRLLSKGLAKQKGLTRLHLRSNHLRPIDALEVLVTAPGLISLQLGGDSPPQARRRDGDVDLQYVLLSHQLSLCHQLTELVFSTADVEEAERSRGQGWEAVQRCLSHNRRCAERPATVPLEHDSTAVPPASRSDKDDVAALRSQTDGMSAAAAAMRARLNGKPNVNGGTAVGDLTLLSFSCSTTFGDAPAAAAAAASGNGAPPPDLSAPPSPPSCLPLSPVEEGEAVFAASDPPSPGDDVLNAPQAARDQLQRFASLRVSTDPTRRAAPWSSELEAAGGTEGGAAPAMGCLPDLTTSMGVRPLTAGQGPGSCSGGGGPAVELLIICAESDAQTAASLRDTLLLKHGVCATVLSSAPTEASGGGGRSNTAATASAADARCSTSEPLRPSVPFSRQQSGRTSAQSLVNKGSPGGPAYHSAASAPGLSPSWRYSPSSTTPAVPGQRYSHSSAPGQSPVWLGSSPFATSPLHSPLTTPPGHSQQRSSISAFSTQGYSPAARHSYSPLSTLNFNNLLSASNVSLFLQNDFALTSSRPTTSAEGVDRHHLTPLAKEPFGSQMSWQDSSCLTDASPASVFASREPLGKTGGGRLCGGAAEGGSAAFQDAGTTAAVLSAFAATLCELQRHSATLSCVIVLLGADAAADPRFVGSVDALTTFRRRQAALAGRGNQWPTGRAPYSQDGGGGTSGSISGLHVILGDVVDGSAVADKDAGEPISANCFAGGASAPAAALDVRRLRALLMCEQTVPLLPQYIESSTEKVLQALSQAQAATSPSLPSSPMASFSRLHGESLSRLAVGTGPADGGGSMSSAPSCRPAVTSIGLASALRALPPPPPPPAYLQRLAPSLLYRACLAGRSADWQAVLAHIHGALHEDYSLLLHDVTDVSPLSRPPSSAWSAAPSEPNSLASTGVFTSWIPGGRTPLSSLMTAADTPPLPLRSATSAPNNFNSAWDEPTTSADANVVASSHAVVLFVRAAELDGAVGGRSSLRASLTRPSRLSRLASAAVSLGRQLVIVADSGALKPPEGSQQPNCPVSEALAQAWSSRLIYHPLHIGPLLLALRQRLGLPDWLLSGLPERQVRELHADPTCTVREGSPSSQMSHQTRIPAQAGPTWAVRRNTEGSINGRDSLRDAQQALQPQQRSATANVQQQHAGAASLRCSRDKGLYSTPVTSFNEAAQTLLLLLPDLRLLDCTHITTLDLVHVHEALERTAWPSCCRTARRHVTAVGQRQDSGGGGALVVGGVTSGSSGGGGGAAGEQAEVVLQVAAEDDDEDELWGTSSSKPSVSYGMMEDTSLRQLAHSLVHSCSHLETVRYAPSEVAGEPLPPGRAVGPDDVVARVAPPTSSATGRAMMALMGAARLAAAASAAAAATTASSVNDAIPAGMLPVGLIRRGQVSELVVHGANRLAAAVLGELLTMSTCALVSLELPAAGPLQPAGLASPLSRGELRAAGALCIGADGCRDLAAGLRDNATLTSLTLADQQLGDAGIAALVPVVASTAAALRILDVSRCGFGAGAWRALQKAFSTNEQFQRIVMTGNPVGNVQTLKLSRRPPLPKK